MASTRRSDDSSGPASRSGTPPHDAKANSVGTPSTRSHTSGELESTRASIDIGGAATRRADGPPLCAPRGTSASASSTARHTFRMLSGEANQILRRPGHEETGPLAGHFVGAGPFVQSDDLRVPAPAVQDLQRRGPDARILQARRVRHVDPLLVVFGVLRAIEEHHVHLQIAVPMDRRSPERVGLRVIVVPAVADRKERRPRDVSPDDLVLLRDSAGRRQPDARPPDHQLAHRSVAVGPREARRGNTLLRHRALVLREEEIEIARVGVELHAEVADAVDEEHVVRVADERAGGRLEDDAEVFPRTAAIARSRRADAWNHLRAAWTDGLRRNFVVVVAVPRAVHVRNDGLHPDAAAGPRLARRALRGPALGQAPASRGTRLSAERRA